jgi:eukaryotic-like serine/threonine-protein kinase
MSQPLTPDPDDLQPEMLGAWNLGGAMDGETGLDDSLLAPPSQGPDTVGRPSKLGVARGGSTGEGVPFHHFALGEQASALNDDGSLLGGPSPVTHAKVSGLEPARSSGPAPTLPAPKKGELLGVFRIVSELGRGAFARVYLAEQVDLGDRLVALKVSRAEGDEPQMLARLQHTHIVPIHSVHDDEETGLRLMCMPYLGGANLAQVLEAAGSRPMEGTAGRSLMDALDEVSQRLQSRSGTGRASLFSGASRLATGLEHGHPAAGPRWASEARSTSRSIFHASFGRGSLDRLNALWGRFTHRAIVEGPAVGKVLETRDFDQPARQFLRGANTIQAAVWIIARLAEGLEHAHSRGLLHRDLKPSNILIAGDGVPMLLDFNLSTTTTPSDPAEGEKAMLGGTLPYMSPEHLDAFNPRGTTAPDAVDERSDVYSLGLILFEMIAGQHPFPEPTGKLPLLEVIRYLTQQRGKVPSLREANPGVSWGLDSILRKCLAPDPSKRYARARDLAEDLNRFLDDLPLRHAREASLRERLAKLARRNPRLCGNTSIAAFTLVLIITLGALIGLLAANMQNLSTRLKLQVFHDDFAECRFLLNLGSGPTEHLGRGIARAQRTLDQQRIDRAGDWRPDSWARRLTEDEQAMLREQTAELILLEARARVYLAGRTGTEADRRQALEWAVQWLNRAERLDLHPPAALYGDRARFHSALGRADLAAGDRQRESEKVPVTSRDFSLIGAALLAEGQLGRAETALLRAIDLDPRAFWALFALGHCHFEQGRYLDAAGDFLACITLEPKFAWPQMNRGLALARAGRLLPARDAYQRALKANPRFAEAWLNLALVNLELNQLSAAERAMGQALALGRHEPGEFVVWAEIKARLGRRDEADKLFAQLLRERPDDPLLLTARGIFRIKSDREGALSDLHRALEVDPGNARAHFGLGLLLRADRPREALTEADAALRSDPELLDALQLRAVLRARLGDLAAYDDAERLSLVQTPHRLYNAACALALLVKTAGQDRLASRAIELLDRALDLNFPAAHAATDPDLDALHPLSAFRDVLQKPRKAADSPNVLNAK